MTEVIGLIVGALIIYPVVKGAVMALATIVAVAAILALVKLFH